MSTHWSRPRGWKVLHTMMRPHMRRDGRYVVGEATTAMIGDPIHSQAPHTDIHSARVLLHVDFGLPWEERDSYLHTVWLPRRVLESGRVNPALDKIKPVWRPWAEASTQVVLYVLRNDVRDMYVRLKEAFLREAQKGLGVRGEGSGNEIRWPKFEEPKWLESWEEGGRDPTAARPIVEKQTSLEPRGSQTLTTELPPTTMRE